MATPPEYTPLLVGAHATSNGHPNGHGPSPPGGGGGGDNSTESAATSHLEHHSGSGYDAVLRDVILGFSDGLTVPFALTAGLSSLGSTRLVIMGGLAELFSGMISMGLGAYLAARTERQHWLHERAREYAEVEAVPDLEREEVYEALGRLYGLSRAACDPLVGELTRDKDAWVRFMMDFELGLGADEPDPRRAARSAFTMGLSYFLGGLIPMLPYFVVDSARDALAASVALTAAILLLFGYAKNWITARTTGAGLRGALETLVIGALAAGTSWAIVRGLDRDQKAVAAVAAWMTR